MKSFKFEKYFNAIVGLFYSVSEAFLNQNLNILAITVCSFIPTIFAKPLLVIVKGGIWRHYHCDITH